MEFWKSTLRSEIFKWIKTGKKKKTRKKKIKRKVIWRVKTTEKGMENWDFMVLKWCFCRCNKKPLKAVFLFLFLLFFLGFFVVYLVLRNGELGTNSAVEESTIKQFNFDCVNPFKSIIFFFFETQKSETNFFFFLINLIIFDNYLVQHFLFGF